MSMRGLVKVLELGLKITLVRLSVMVGIPYFGMIFG